MLLDIVRFRALRLRAILIARPRLHYMQCGKNNGRLHFLLRRLVCYHSSWLVYSQ